MNLSRQNLLLVAAAAILIILPLVFFSSPSSTADGSREGFVGTDRQAEGVVRQLAPDYQPWFPPLLTPPSGEMESLLFALQAALGAGALGYYLGFSRGRAKAGGRDGDSSGVA